MCSEKQNRYRMSLTGSNLLNKGVIKDDICMACEHKKNEFI